MGNIIWLSNQSNQKFEAASGTSNLCNYANNFQLKNPTSHEISTAFTPWRSSPAVTSSSLTQSKIENAYATAPNSWNQKSLNFQQSTMPGTTMPPNTGPHFSTSMATASTIPPYYMSQHDQMRPSAPYAPLYNGQSQRYVYPHNAQTSFVVTNPNFSMTTTTSREHAVNTVAPAFQSFENTSNTKVTKSSISHAVPSSLNKAQQNYIHDSAYPQERSKKDIKTIEMNMGGALTPKKVPKVSVDLFAIQNIENISHKTDNSTNNPSQKCTKNIEFGDFHKNSPSNLQSADNPLMYPAHFMKGSIIQLAHGQLKRVEDMRTDDFIECTKTSADLKIDSSTVIKIVEKENTATLNFSVGEQKIQVTN